MSQTASVTVARYVRARVQDLASRAPADGGVAAAWALLKIAEVEAAAEPLADAAAGCIPGLVAALDSEEQVIWKAALNVLGLAAMASADSQRAIAAAGGVPAAAQLVQAHSSDSCTLQWACEILRCLALHGAEMSQLIADCGAIPALLTGLAAADCATVVDGFAAALAAVVHDVPSSASQVAVAGGVTLLLLLCTLHPAGSIARRAAEKVLGRIVDWVDGGWGTVQIAAAQYAETLPPDAQRTLMEVARQLRPQPTEQQPAARSSGASSRQQPRNPRRLTRLSWRQQQRQLKRQLKPCCKRSSSRRNSRQPKQQARRPSGSAGESGSRRLRQLQLPLRLQQRRPLQLKQPQPALLLLLSLSSLRGRQQRQPPPLLSPRCRAGKLQVGSSRPQKAAVPAAAAAVQGAARSSAARRASTQQPVQRQEASSRPAAAVPPAEPQWQISRHLLLCRARQLQLSLMPLSWSS